MLTQQTREYDLVIAFAAGYDFSTVKKFTQSLIDCGSKARVHFFITEHEESYIRAQKIYPNLSYECVAKPLRPGSAKAKIAGVVGRVIFPLLPLHMLTRSAAAAVLRHLLIPHTIRYVYALSLLESLDPKPQRVLLSDCRDVYFQSDPFETLEDGLHCSRESVRLYYERINYGWMQRFLNGHEIKKIQFNIISCSGVTIGGTNEIMRYLRLMNGEFAQRIGAVAGAIADQALHNHIVYANQAELNIRWADNGGRLVFTAGTSLFREVSFKEGRLETTSGSIIAIIHQFQGAPPSDVN